MGPRRPGGLKEKPELLREIRELEPRSSVSPRVCASCPVVGACSLLAPASLVSYRASSAASQLSGDPNICTLT